MEDSIIDRPEVARQFILYLSSACIPNIHHPVSTTSCHLQMKQQMFQYDPAYPLVVLFCQKNSANLGIKPK